MLPTLAAGDFILADKTAYKKTLFQIGWLSFRDTVASRADIVVFALRHHAFRKDRPYLIKRVVALPGDTLAMQDGHLVVHPEKLTSLQAESSMPQAYTGIPGNWHFSYLVPTVQHRHYQPTGTDWGPIVVPEDAYFVLGDNRNESVDSRDFGFVRSDELEAKFFMLLHWP